MTADPSRALRVAMVFTRAAQDDIGREKTMRAVRDALTSRCDVTLLRLHSIAETRKPRDVAGAIGAWLWSLLAWRPMALQCVLFAGPVESGKLVRAIAVGGFDTVYVDMVRSAYFLTRLRRALPGIAVITDLDDLISRRMAFAAKLGLPLSLGFAGRFLPPLLREFVERLLPARLVYRHEAACVARAERDMALASQAVVLVSSVECDLLAQMLPAQNTARIHAITPPAKIRADAAPRAMPVRFVFVGSDSYQPNRLAIDFLLDRWRHLMPQAQLHIYGRQKRPPAAVPGLVWHGFVADVADAYTPDSIALMPCLVPGGIKTKVTEAWSFGCPVLGNPQAFEGLLDPGYPLAVPLAQWDGYLRDPLSHMDDWRDAAQLGQAQLARLSPQLFRDAWCGLAYGADAL